MNRGWGGAGFLNWCYSAEHSAPLRSPQNVAKAVLESAPDTALAIGLVVGFERRACPTFLAHMRQAPLPGHRSVAILRGHLVEPMTGIEPPTRPRRHQPSSRECCGNFRDSSIVVGDRT